MAGHPNSFGARSILSTDEGPLTYYSLSLLEQAGFSGIDRLPYSIRILLENLLRHENGFLTTSRDIEKMALWAPAGGSAVEVPFMPARVLLQDFTGVPAIVDLAAMRDAAQRLYGEPSKINPLIPSELVIDHSVQVDVYGSSEAVDRNTEFDYHRNSERYAFLRWGQKSFHNFSVVPPATGICHQVNLEYLARGVCVGDSPLGPVAYPDTLVGLDSHTTMINGLGVLGWGVGGIEAEAVMLGRPYYLLTPQVIGFYLEGKPARGTTATDLVLTITQMLRKKGVVGKFVEFFGPGVIELSIEDRATIANMAPEYGATMGFFPIDEKTLQYLRLTGRPDKSLNLVEAYCKTQGLFRTGSSPVPVYSDVVSMDMNTIEPCLAGPKRPQDRVLLKEMKPVFDNVLQESCGVEPRLLQIPATWEHEGGRPSVNEPEADSDASCKIPQRKGVGIIIGGRSMQIDHGAVVIAAITSCTNTSNPSVLIAAGLLAKRAVERGLSVKPWVKTSFAPGSKVPVDYLVSSGLMPYLERLNFYLVAFGCTTCIGNSGPLDDSISKAIKDHDLIVAAVLSGNRNFEGRINPLSRINYLASPPLVVAYAIAGTVDIHFETEPLAMASDGTPVYLKDIWPSPEEIQEMVTTFNTPDRYQRTYAAVFDGDAKWKSLPTPEYSIYPWDTTSTYIKEPPFFQHITQTVPPCRDIQGARVLALLEDSITTDHISPAGAIPVNSPAGQYLISQNIMPPDFNSYGSRRGNHEVMIRGTFANIRLKNRLVPGTDGGWTMWLPDGEKMTIYDASMKYQEKGIPLLVLAGKEYGTGSSRDWAAKGTLLLGIKAVVAESFERIHRSNLICMGVLPLQFKPGDGHSALGLNGTETYQIAGIETNLFPGKELPVIARNPEGSEIRFQVIARLDSPVEVTYYRHGGILNYVLRSMA
ncbi:MAG: aconitate hydratase AcnA [Deltaproteobacteria bacterium]|nr:aconitate hydratase AcnA [Deltaproteobacteria bacterium]